MFENNGNGNNPFAPTKSPLGDNVQVQERVQENIENIQEEEQVPDDTMYEVILNNNEETSFEAVVDVLMNVFGHSEERSHQIMMRAHTRGYAICDLGSQAHCERQKTNAETYCGQNDGQTIDGVQEGGEDRPHYYGELIFRVQPHNQM